MKQKTIRVFEVEDFEKLKNIIESKFELIKNHYFMLKEPNKEIQEFLKNKNLNYFVINSDESFTSKKEKLEKEVLVKVVEKEIIKQIDSDNFKIFEKVIRNGEEIEVDCAVFLNKINPGAKIKINKQGFFFDENRGNIIIEGNFLFVRKNKGNIVYNSEEIGEIEKDTVFYEDKRLEL